MSQTAQAVLPVDSMNGDDEVLVFPCSFAQQRLWFLDQLVSGSVAYNVPVAVRLTGELNVPALCKALSEVVRRHEVLRTTFGTIDGQPVQVVSPPQPVTLPLVSLRLLEGSRREKEAHRIVKEEAGRPFNLETGPLLRATLLQLGKQEHVALLNMHHIISDAWSRGVLVSELGKLYEQFDSGVESGLDELPLQYADYALWQREWLQGEVLEEQLSYWREQLKEVPPVIDLPMDRPRPPVHTTKGASYSFKLSQELSEELQALSRAEGATLFMLMLAGFQALLYRYSRQREISVGTPIAGRNRAETEGLIGCFINTLVLKSEVRPEESFRSFARRVKEICLGAYAHQDLPFEKLVDELGVERSLSHTPLFQVLFLMQNTPQEAFNVSRLQMEDFYGDPGVAKFDLNLSIVEGNKNIVAIFGYNTDLFDLVTIQRMSSHFQTLLSGIVTEPDALIRDLPLLSHEEREELIVGCNETRREYPEGVCVHELIEQQVRRTPEEIAVVFGDEHVTYNELNARANQLAHRLRRMGVGPESRVAILMERSVELVVSLLGVLKAGGAYVPLEPDYPEERLRYMLEDSQPALLLRGVGQSQLENSSGAPVLCVEEQALAEESSVNLEVRMEASSLAYVIYTSGSTGTPKGAMNEHRALVNRLLWMQETFGLGPRDAVLQKTPLSFDVSIWEFFWPLMTGARLVVAEPGGQRDAVYIARLIQKEGVTTLHFVPPMLGAFLEEPEAVGCARVLRRVMCGGEAVTWSLQERFFEQLKGVELHDLYGPTEAAIDVTSWHCQPGYTSGVVPIGRPVANTQIHVVDERLEVVPKGVAGELCIGGVQVGRGYLKRPSLTAERFVPDPFSVEEGARLYRTGDVVRRLRDGEVEYLGRLDHQVKVRGFRIELGEIEAALSRHAQVRKSVVMVRQDGPGEKRLVAYLVADPAPAPTELQQFLQQSLPDYMVPAAFVFLPQLPLNPNGKVDRNALPPPDTSFHPKGEYIAPRTPAEETLCEVWQEVLRLERVGVHDNFFELGGDSILSIQVVSKAARRGLQLTPRQMFQHQTLSALAAAATAPRKTTSGSAMNATAPLTPIQRWFFNGVTKRRDYWNQAVLLELATPAADPAVLSTALRVVLRHHPSLRMRFTQGAGGEWSQQYGDVGPSPLTVIDLDGVSSEDKSRVIQQASRQAQLSLAIERESLLRAVLFNCGVTEPARLLVVIHHLVVDGVSWRVLLEDWQATYEQIAAGVAPEAVQLLAERTPFITWAQRLHEFAQSDEVQAELDYWLAGRGSETDVDSRLNGSRGFELPVDFAGGRNLECDSSSVSVSLKEEETHALLREVPAVYHTEVNDALLTALARCLWCWTGNTRPAVVLEGHGREDFDDDLDTSRTVGWFTTLYPVDLEVGHDIGADLKAVKERLRGVPRHGLGFGLLRYFGPRGWEHEALASRLDSSIVFNYLGQLDGVVGGNSMFRPARESAGKTRWGGSKRMHLLGVNASVARGRLNVEWNYSRELHRRESIERVAEYLIQELRSLIAHCRGEGAGGFTPSDFPLSRLTQEQIDRLAKLRGAKAAHR